MLACRPSEISSALGPFVDSGVRPLRQGMKTVLLIEDDADEALLMREAIGDVAEADITLVHVETLEKALISLAGTQFDAVLLDLSLPDSIGIEGVAPVVKIAGDTPVIVCTGLNDQEKGRDAILRGAHDYLVKSHKLYGAIPRILHFAIERGRIIKSAKRKVEKARRYSELLLTRVILISNSGLGIVNEEGNFTVVNPALAELVGCQTSELRGKPWSKLIPEQDRAAEHQAYMESLDRDADYNRDRMDIQKWNGGIVEVSMRSTLIDFYEKRLCRVLSFGSPSTSDLGTQVDLPGGQFGNKWMFSPGDTDTRGTADGLQIVGLTRIKAELGDRWSSVAERVVTMAERTIAKRLSPGDTCMRNQYDEFIIRFNGVSKKEASMMARAVSREIQEKVLGYGDESELADAD